MDPRIKDALRILEENSRVRLCDVAAKVGLSGSRLEHMLRRATGRSFREHLQAARISNAAKLLGNYRLSVKEIAFLVGYSSQSSLSRAFRGAFHCTPSEYRRRSASQLTDT